MRYEWRCLTGLITIYLLPFAPHIAEAQIPAIGTEATLDVATWNIEWFGSDTNGPSEARQLANVRAVIDQADIDLWGLQEIADPNDFAALLDGLGDGYDGVLATESGEQRIGFLYKTEVFSSVVVRHILTTFDFAFAGRPPLQLQADVTLGDETRRLTFIVLHMKAFSDQQSYERRVEASGRLKNNIDFGRPDDDPIVVLGDFNDELTGSIRAGQPSPYDNFLQDTTRYFFPSLSIEEAGLGTFCGNSAACTTGSTIDHVLVTDELAPFYETDSAARFEALLSTVSGYVTTTSDHLPVFARFRFPTGTAAEAEALPETVVVERVYPNPFYHRATLTYTLPRAAAVRVEVFDVLGRRVATLADGFQPSGLRRLVLAGLDWPSGLLLIRLIADGVVHSQRVVHLR